MRETRLSDAPRLTLVDAHCVDPVRAVEALEFYVAAFEEVDARAGDQVVDELRDQYFVSDRVACDACGVVDRGAEEVVFLV
jgi:hypothetical protein